MHLALKQSFLRVYLVYFCAIAPLGMGLCLGNPEAFLAFGDAGMGNSGQQEVADSAQVYCRSHLCNFVAFLGDNIYPSGVESVVDSQWQSKFERPYNALDLDFHPCLGNHDYFGNIQAQIEYSQVNPHWKFPHRYYAFNSCWADFFVLDTEKWDVEQENWLREQLVLSTARWKIVYGHRPIFSHGGHGDSKTLQAKLLPIIQDKADLYLSGHDHHLEYISRGYRPDFIISGAGAENRPADSGKTTLFTGNQIGFVHIQLQSDKAVITYVGSGGEELFTYEKSPGSP